MKRVLVLFIFLIGLTSLNAQEFKGLDKSPMDVAVFPKSYKNPNKVVKITYSRPQLKGRNIEKLATAGKVWRTGANEATEITFFKNVVFGGKKVKAGTYSLFTIPGEKEWTVILNSDLNVWGAYTYKKENDIVRVSAKVTVGDKKIEAFSMIFDEKMNLYMGWGNIVVTVPMRK